MQLAQMIDALVAEGDGYCVRCPETWTQGRTLFGGLQVALMVKAMRDRVPVEVPLRSVQTSFIGPVMPGKLHLRARVLRQGKSVIQAEAQILDGEQVACATLAVFGRARTSAVSLTPPPPIVTRDPKASQQMPFFPWLSPAFTQFVEQRWSHGAMPFCGGAEARTQIHLRFRNEPRVDEFLAIALADAIPSPAISVLRRPAPASSMTWTLELLHDRPQNLTDGYWLMDAEVSAASDGYAYQTATLWSPDLQPVALSRQSTVVFG